MAEETNRVQIARSLLESARSGRASSLPALILSQPKMFGLVRTLAFPGVERLMEARRHLVAGRAGGRRPNPKADNCDRPPDRDARQHQQPV